MQDTKQKGIWLCDTLLQDHRLSCQELILLSVIKSFTETKGNFQGSNAYLAKQIRVTANRVSRYISELKKLGYINVEEVFNKGITLRAITYLPIVENDIPIVENNIPLVENDNTTLLESTYPIVESNNTPLLKTTNNNIDYNIDNNKDIVVVDNSDKKPKKSDPAPPSLTTYIKQIKQEGDNLPDKHKELVKPYFAAISKEYGEEKLYDIMLKNLKFPPKIKEIIQICEWAESKNYDIQKVLLKFGNYEKKKRVKYTRLLVTLMGWKFTSEEVGKDATTITINNQNLPVYAAKTF